MASELAVYASQCRLPEHHARLASGRWLSFTGWSFTTGFQRKVSNHMVMTIPLSQACLAQLFLRYPVRVLRDVIHSQLRAALNPLHWRLGRW